MNSVIPLEDMRDGDRERAGGKAFSLAMMARHRMNVPDGLCISTEAYRDYVASTGSRERIILEVNRKNFDEMRWEEMWDASWLTDTGDQITVDGYLGIVIIGEMAHSAVSGPKTPRVSGNESTSFSMIFPEGILLTREVVLGALEGRS